MPARALQRYFPTEPFGAIRAVRPMQQGLSGSVVHAVETDSGAYVLRLQGSERAAWEQSVSVQRVASW